MREEEAHYVVDVARLPHCRDFVVVPTVEQVRASLREDDGVTFVIESDGRNVGILYLATIGTPVWLVELRLLVIAEPRRGYGAAAVAFVQRHAFAELKAHRLWLEVTAKNVRARRLYERCGFVQEGIWRDGFRAHDGSYEDLVAYGMLASEYRASFDYGAARRSLS